MSVHLDEYKLSYFSLPKAACTSLKTFFFEVENGFPYKDYLINGQLRHIHNAGYPTVGFDPGKLDKIQDHWKIAVVRDPIDRLLSCYSNRVLFHRELDNVELTEEDREKGMWPRPSLYTFVDHLERYQELSASVRHHSMPMTVFLGRDAEIYDRIYNMAELSQLVDDVAGRVGKVPELRRMQQGGAKTSPSELWEGHMEKLRRFYRADYRIYGSFLAAAKESKAAI